MKIQEKMTQSKAHNFPVTNPEDMEFCDLPNKEFKTGVSRKLNELQEIKKIM